LINAFTRKAVSRLEHKIAGHARSIVDRVIGDRSEGECNFVTDVAADLPLLCLADLFGLPREDRYLMLDWANRVIGYQDPDYATSAAFDREAGTDMARQALKYRPATAPDGTMPDPRTREGMADLYRYAHLLAEHKRAQPGDDIMSLLLAQEDDSGHALSVEEFENMFWLFAVAGNETLRNGIPGGMLALLEHPQHWARLRDEPDGIDGMVDEMLRWWTPVMNFRRTAVRATELAGQRLEAGDKVIVSFLSANHDERVFQAPERFDPGRTPNPHLSFGYGPHYCIGAQLAVAQMRALFLELARRWRHVEPAGAPRFLRSNFQRGVKSLPVRWQVA
jgi:cytochrome P450